MLMRTRIVDIQAAWKSTEPVTVNLIASCVQVRKGSIVYDPFVGTGSILVGAAHLGAITVGLDIDVRVIRDGKQVRSQSSQEVCCSGKAAGAF